MHRGERERLFLKLALIAKAVFGFAARAEQTPQ
jgi:hypothetical protein